MPTQEETTTQSQAQRATAPKQNQNVEQKIQKLRELYADAPELGKVALEKDELRVSDDSGSVRLVFKGNAPDGMDEVRG